MSDGSGLPETLAPALRAALERKGHLTLTSVQRAVLEPRAADRDLRISSQTGSGKTVAIGFVLGNLLAERDGHLPRALVIAPTRELARQVEHELGWLFADLGARVVTVTGGSSYRDEHRALASRPHVVVGTPGRLLDHVERGTLDLAGIGAVVLDEADRMLDLGFREALESILGRCPAERRTHLVSATFADEVGGLADRVQTDALRVEGTRLGAANADIDHVVHLVAEDERFDAIVNLLLAEPDARTLVFARTRADVASIAEDLGEAGFAVAPLSGEMDQRERNRALGAFRRGAVRVLVATDVAARGLDVQEVSRVVHVEAPTDPDDYTHRSGRTGRAGRKGTSALLVTPRELPRARSVLARARVRHRFEPIPDAAAIRAAQDERVVRTLGAGLETAIDPRALALAAKLVESGDAAHALARLLAEGPVLRGPAPREVRVVVPPKARPRRDADRAWPEVQRRGPSDEPVSRAHKGPGRQSGHGAPRHPEHAPRHQVGRDDVRQETNRPSSRREEPERGAPRREIDRGSPKHEARAWAPFHVTWGARHGADTRRLLAMVCRRGGIASDEVGTIRVGPVSSEIEVALEVAPRFAEAVRRPRPPRPPRAHPARQLKSAAGPDRNAATAREATLRTLPRSMPCEIDDLRREIARDAISGGRS